MKKSIIVFIINLLFLSNISLASNLNIKLAKLKDLYKERKYTQAVQLIENDYEIQELKEISTVEIPLNYQYLIARSYHQVKMFAKAIDYYYLITQRDTVLADYALFNMAECYRDIKKYHYAVYYYGLLIEKYPNSFYICDAYYNRALCFKKDKKYREGIDEINKIIEKYPYWNPAMVFYEKGILFELMMNWTDALLTYQKAISLYPKSEYAIKSLTNIKYIEKKYPSYKFKIESSHIWDRGMAYFYSRAYKEAIAQFKEIIDKNMDKDLNDNCYNMMGKAYYKRYNYWKAVEFFKEAISKYPESETYVDSLFELANSYIRVGNGDSALWLYKKIDTEHSFSGFGDSALFKIAEYYEAKGKYEDSIDTFLQLIEKYPMSMYNDSAYWQIASIYRQKKNHRKAVKYFELLCSYFPNSHYAIDARYWTGKCYEKLGEWDFASNTYKRMLTVNSNNKNYYYFRARERLNWINLNKYKCLSWEEQKQYFDLAVSYYQKKQLDKAIENFRKVIYLYENSNLYSQSINYIEKSYKELKIWAEIFNEKEISSDKLLDSFISKYSYTEKYNNRLKYLNSIKELLILGLYDEAGKEIEKLRRIDYKDIDLLYTYIIASKESQQYYKAIEVTESLIRLITDQKDRIYLKDELFLPEALKIFLYPAYFSEYVEKYAKDFDIDPLFVYAIIREESRFKIKAKSHAYAIGLMQIIPQTGRFIAHQIGMKKFSVDSLNDPETNIKMGIWYIRYLLDEFNGNKLHTLAAYNGGHLNVKRWIKKCSDQEDMDEFISNIKFDETHNYVKKVMNSFNHYREIYAFVNP